MTGLPPLLILRHGETVWNREGRLQGRADSALTETGRAQAQRQRDILAACDLGGYAACVSPLGRAQQTAQIALESFTGSVKIDPRLAEIDVGAWQGLTWDTIAPGVAVRDRIALYDKAPGGEGLAAVETRCADLLRGLAAPSVLITHGVTARMLRSLALGRTGLEQVAVLGDAQGCVFRIEEHMEKVLT